MMFEGKSFIHKLWIFLRTYILTLHRFDLFLQGALLIVILLESNVYLLLRRDADAGRNAALIEDWVLVIAGGVEFALGAVLAWWGTGRRHFALATWLGVTSLSGLLVLAVPFKDSNPANVELCDGSPVEVYSQSQLDGNAPVRTTLLIMTALLCGLSKVSIWSHGLTYLDDHDPQNGPYFYGILISIRLSLGLSGTNWLRPASMRDNWWEAHLSVCMLTLMFAILFTLFPKKMPQWQDEEILVNTEFRASLHRVSTNKTIVMQTLALSFLTTAIFCFVHYDNAFVQARFYMETIRDDPRTSRALSDIFRSLVIIFFIMIFRVRFSARRIEGVKANTASRVGGVVAIFVAVFFVVLSVLSCNTGEMEGFEDGTFQQLECSEQCGCSSERYGFSPVCGLDSFTTFFSPCNVGCNQYEDLNGFVLYHNCTCGDQRAVRGSCTLDSCRTAFSVYQVFYTIILAVSGASFLLQGVVLLRAVRRIDKPIAVGFSFAIVALFSFVFGRLLYLGISYFTCAYSNDGLCVFHRPTLWVMTATSAVMSLTSAITSILASRVPPEPTTEL